MPLIRDWGRPEKTRGDRGMNEGERGRLGETGVIILGASWGTAGALLSNLQLVPGRDNIGDEGL